MTPNYMVMGTPKAGTTSFCKALSLHPDVFLTNPKEPFFFCADAIYSKGLEWYESLYQGSETAQARGEGSAAYSMSEVFPHTIERIADYSRELKLFFLVREPYSRIESHWMELVNQDHHVRYDFNKAVQENQNILIHSGNYLRQLQRWYEYFPKDAIKVVFFEELITQPDMVYRDCFEHLGLDFRKWDNHRAVHENRSVDKRIPNRFLTTKWGGAFVQALCGKLHPRTARRLKRRLFFKKVSGRPEWSADTRLLVQAQLKADLETFLLNHGKPVDYWGTLT